MAYKVFTNGSTLQASEVNDNLMKQAVATFSNAAARTAAITSPVEGQLTYLEDTDRYQWWSGSAWRSPFGMTHVVTQTIAPGTSTVSLNNVFTSEYTNYKILLNILGSATFTFTARMRVGGADNSAASYDTQTLTAAGTGVSAVRATGGTSFRIGGASTIWAGIVVDLFDPAVSKTTNGFVQSAYFSALEFEQAAIRHQVNTAFDGISFIAAGATIQGSVSVYGMRI